MSSFRSMGCEVVLPDEAPVDGVKALFDERDRRFSRFIENSEVNRVNALPFGVAFVSEDMASMLAAALDAARATGGLVTPAVGGALLAAGYDRDFADLPADRLPPRRSPWSRRSRPSRCGGECSCAPSRSCSI